MLTISKSELLHAHCLVPNNIYEGIHNYSHQIIEDTADGLTHYLLKKMRENGESNTFFDFYYGTLPVDAKEKANKVLSSEEILTLTSFPLSDNPTDIFYRYNPILFLIAIKLSVSEMLFSTFYFAKTRETVWSNFDGKFVVFSPKN